MNSFIKDSRNLNIKMTDLDETFILQSEDINQNSSFEDIDDISYYIATISYFILIISGTYIVPNIDIIFGFVGTICVNLLGFIFPSVFYQIARKKCIQINSFKSNSINSNDIIMLISSYI